MPPKKKFTVDMELGYIGVNKSKAKPREVDDSRLKALLDKRDDSWLNDLFAPEYLKELILERRK